MTCTESGAVECVRDRSAANPQSSRFATVDTKCFNVKKPNKEQISRRHRNRRHAAGSEHFVLKRNLAAGSKLVIKIRSSEKITALNLASIKTSFTPDDTIKATYEFDLPENDFQRSLDEEMVLNKVSKPHTDTRMHQTH